MKAKKTCFTATLLAPAHFFPDSIDGNIGIWLILFNYSSTDREMCCSGESTLHFYQPLIHNLYEFPTKYLFVVSTADVYWLRVEKSYYEGLLKYEQIMFYGIFIDWMALFSLIVFSPAKSSLIL